MDENKLFENHEALLPKLSEFLKSINSPESSKPVVLYQFSTGLPLVLSAADMKNPKNIKDYSQLKEPEEVAETLLKFVSSEEENKRNMSLYDELSKKFDETEEEFIKALRNLKKKTLSRVFPHIHVKEFLIDYLNGALNDPSVFLERLSLLSEAIQSSLFKTKESLGIEAAIKKIEERRSSIVNFAIEKLRSFCQFSCHVKVHRFKEKATGWSHNPNSIDAISVMVNKPIYLAGIGIYRPNAPGVLCVNASICFDSDNQVLFQKKLSVAHLSPGMSDEGGYNTLIYKLMFDQPLEIPAGKVFVIKNSGEGAVTHYGTQGVSKISLENGAIVTFLKNSLSTNSTDQLRGAIPSIYFI